MKVTMFSLVVGAVVTPVEGLEKKLKDIGIETKITELQKTVLIYTSRILRNKSYPLVEINFNNNNKINNNNNNNNNINDNDDDDNNNNNNNNSSNNIAILSQ